MRYELKDSWQMIGPAADDSPLKQGKTSGWRA